MRLFIVVVALVFPIIAISQTTSTSKDEVYDFQFDKSVAKEHAIKQFLSTRKPSEVNHSELLFSSVNGKNCEGEPAKYVIVFANSQIRPDFPQYVIFDVSFPNQWLVFTDGSGGTRLSWLIKEFRRPDFKYDILCGN